MKHLISVAIPHASNNYRPHIIKKHTVATLAVLLIVGQIILNYASTGHMQILGYATNVSSSELLSLTNTQRANSGLGALRLNSKLSSAAQSKASHMITNNYWAHVAPDGTTPWYFIDQSGYSYKRAGENLAYGFATSSGIITGWMNSPAHAANILDKSFEEVGFGIANGANFQGDKNTIIVAMYGDPTTLSSSPQSNTTTPQQSPENNSNTPKPSTEADSTTNSEQQDQAAESQQETENQTTSTPDNSSRNSQSNAISQLENTSQIQISSRPAAEIGSETITIFEALITGQAHWFLYVSLGILLTIGAIYFIRHLTAIFQLVVHGEHYLEGHPLLEASLIYAAIWLIMVSSYGVIL